MAWRRAVGGIGSIPFWAVHVAALAGVASVGWSWSGLALLGASYGVRMFFVTAGYHRYFSHRAFKTSRPFQLLLAVAAMTSAQKGVLWWAANHRWHHRHADGPEDPHSPIRRGLWWAHVGWIVAGDYNRTAWERVHDLARFPELRWLNRHYLVPPFALALVLSCVGGWWALVWGFLAPTVLLWHGSFSINSLGHLLGSRRFATPDQSRNNPWLAVLTCGEGWHNNHHHYQSAARQGLRWWEIDLTYYGLVVLSWLGLVWDLRAPPRTASPKAEAEDGIGHIH